MSQSYDPATGQLRPVLRKTLIGLVVSLGALAATGASSGPARAQWTVSATPSALFSESYSPYTATVSSVADASLLPGLIEFQNPTNSAGLNPYNMSWNGQTTLYLTINPSSAPAVLSDLKYAYYASGSGTQDNIDTTWQASWAYGPNIVVTNNASLALTNVPEQMYANGVLIASSYGAKGWPQSGKGTTNVPWGGAVGGGVDVTNAGSITVNTTETITGTYLPWSPFVSGIYGSSTGGVGAGGKTNDTDFYGVGGNGGPVAITTNSGSSIVLQGAGNASGTMNGITAFSQGALPGCDCSGDHANLFGASGAGGAITIQHGGSIVSTATDSIGIVAASIGGAGGTLSGSGVGASQGTSGPGGPVSVTVESGGSISMTSGNAVGILAVSAEGASYNPYVEYNTGVVTQVTVTIDQGGSVASTGGGVFNAGVLAISTGTSSILQPFNSNNVAIGGGGYANFVTVTNNGSITTSGQMAIGIGALSVGGAGIATNVNPSGYNFLGSISNGAASGGSVTVTNGGTIVTDGASAFGIVALSAGAGGLANIVSSFVPGSGGLIVGGDSASSNPGGAVAVTNTGTITTGDGAGGGGAAIGIVAQSIGGGGGSAGGGTAAFVGDSGGAGGAGGNVSVTNAGAITTKDTGAIGILAQSIGGGGGNGANAAGIFVAVGGEGGSGGGGGSVAVSLNPGAGLTTSGDFAAGVIAQSVGGGGGNGGYATSWGPFVSASVGGVAGGGGAGGQVTLTNEATLTTTGEQSLGILAQSIGGGGGNGGAANAYSEGVAFSSAIALGGTGGGGGDGGTVTVNTTSSISTKGPDSAGVVAQSIGGGGGEGGAATAKALAVGVPDIPTLSFTASLGATGGSGGAGGAVSINNAGSIVTNGSGAYGLLAQSIGAGGGNGGDSTAAAYAIESESTTIKLSVALGAAGGVGGNGGSVTIVNGDTTACPNCVGLTQTGGQNAPGILAQSVGGGGGASTAGSSGVGSPNLGGSTGSSVSLDLGLGATGGGGGSGGLVNVSSASNSSISTTGSGSQGILAQSIGGGGGYAGGGSASGSQDLIDINVAVGGNGGGGGVGGSVTVVNASSIKTIGGDSVGILAQSIGGGGGVAGSTDAAASISLLTQTENVINVPSSSSFTADVAVGGVGGGAGTGGTVAVTNSGAITTRGERAYGIEAQSIGGGGGNGGAATAMTNPSITSRTYSANVTVGGGGGASGDANWITVANSAAILTKGYNAYGVLAQSIGGGGGVGGETSISANSTIGLGVGVNGNGGASGTGGSVAVTTSPGGTITTLGDDAIGILAQSIGGGGGAATSGCTNSASLGVAAEHATACFGNTSVSATTNGPGTFIPRIDLSLKVGGNASAAGAGNLVSVTVGDAIVTTGARSMGVVAQSIGGGGGYAAGAAQTLAGTTLVPNPGSNTGTGGWVNVTLQPGASITTSGAGAWGILAQSIGGGGGFVGDPSLPMPLPVSYSSAIPPAGAGNAYANTVTVDVYGDITTTGANAHGVFAQSIGGSGGVAAGGGNSSSATLIAGNSVGGAPTYWGNGAAINITQYPGSIIKTSGLGSTAIVAQSSSTQSSNSIVTNPITVTIGGAVIGGTNGGQPVPQGFAGAAGILLSGGGYHANPNVITVNSGGSVGTVDGLQGLAIAAGGGNYGQTAVSNSGTITGSINLWNFGAIVNNPTGVLNAGRTLYAPNVINGGKLNVWGAQSTGTTYLTGNYGQALSGTLGVNINALAGQRAGLLAVSGDAELYGSVAPNATAVLPGSYTILTTANLSAFGAAAPSSLLFNWSLIPTSTSVSVSPSANFLPAGVSLTPNQSSLANYFNRAWVNSDPHFATVFGSLSQIQSAAAYLGVLNSAGSAAVSAQGTNLARAGVGLLGSALSCPRFVGDGVILGEDSCEWIRGAGGQASQYAGSGYVGYTVGSDALRMGLQKQVAPGWYVGGAFGAGRDSVSATGSSSSGQTFDGSLAVKYLTGPWLFAGSVGFADGSFSNSRYFNGAVLPNAPVASGTLSSESSVYQVGARLRAAYEFAFANTYIRPYADLDLIHTTSPGFSETGLSGAALAYGASRQTTFVASPMVEFGGRYDFANGLTLRAFADVGASFRSNDRWVNSASFIGASPADGQFQIASSTAPVVGHVNLGAQLYFRNGLDIQALYGLEAGKQYVGQVGSLRLGLRF